MRLTIIKEDSIIGVDGVFLTVELGDFPRNIRALQWDGTSGHIESDTGHNVPLTSIEEYQKFVDRWVAAKQEIDAKIANPLHGLERSEAVGLLTKGVVTERFRRKAAGVKAADGLVYHSDDNSITTYLLLHAAAPDTSGFLLEAVTGQTKPATAEAVKELLDLCLALRAQSDAAARHHLAEIKKPATSLKDYNFKGDKWAPSQK